MEKNILFNSFKLRSKNAKKILMILFVNKILLRSISISIIVNFGRSVTLKTRIKSEFSSFQNDFLERYQENEKIKSVVGSSAVTYLGRIFLW